MLERRLRRVIPYPCRSKCEGAFGAGSQVGSGLAGMALAQNQPLTIRVDVPLVAINVEVSDSYGRPVTGLRWKISCLRGRTPVCSGFGPADAPYSLILTFDCSEHIE
jgi:hypothetical protein